MTSLEIILLPADNDRLSNFCGALDVHLRQIETRLQVEIANRGNQFRVSGLDNSVKAACAVMHRLFATTEQELLTAELIHLAMQDASVEVVLNTSNTQTEQEIVIKAKFGLIRGRGTNQQTYLKKIFSHDVNFGVGPAGTGK
ncbi:MAG: hypothetical protein RIT35_1266, partial [Pseudomonadota bacterium]